MALTDASDRAGQDGSMLGRAIAFAGQMRRNLRVRFSLLGQFKYLFL
jgi:hypothetical protein